jgi:hypothetical protein
MLQDILGSMGRKLAAIGVICSFIHKIVIDINTNGTKHLTGQGGKQSSQSLRCRTGGAAKKHQGEKWADQAPGPVQRRK